jgi:NTP pyrophosphatase (non-canonical NTP hydrolase)
MKSRLKSIFYYFGIDNQLKQLNSEMYELTEAIIEEKSRGSFEKSLSSFKRAMSNTFKTPNTDKYREHIIEEIADVFVVLEQFRHHYEITNEELEKMIRYKVDRTSNRILQMQDEVIED